MASHFPHGWNNGVVIKGVPIEIPHSGKVFWVNNSGVNPANGKTGVNRANAGTYLHPYSTVDFGITQCTAGRGDVVYVMPGHAETVTATSLSLDVAGVTVINLGQADSRPTYTMAAATGTVNVSAANCAWVGGYFKSTILDCASAFTIAAGKGFTLDGAFFEDTTASLNYLSIVTTGATDNDADDLTVTNNVWYGLNTTPLAFVSILAAELRPNISFNRCDLAATSGGEFITLAAKVVLGAMIEGNIHNVVGATGTATGIFLTGSGTSVGVMRNNMVASLDTTGELIITAGTGLVQFENYYTGTADKSGKLWPLVDAA